MSTSLLHQGFSIRDLLDALDFFDLFQKKHLD